jgi:hypothetical protein
MEQLYNFFVFFGVSVFNVLVSLTLFKRRKSLAFTLVVYAVWVVAVTVAGFTPETKNFPFFIFLFLLAVALTLVCYEGGAWQKLFIVCNMGLKPSPSGETFRLTGWEKGNTTSKKELGVG